jgi:hypothetical protein
MVMSRDQHARQNHDIKIGNTSLGRVEQLRYLKTNVINQVPIMKKLSTKLVRECLLPFGAESFVLQFAS